MAPSALTKSSSWMSFHSRLAPISASALADLTEPRSRFTSSGGIGPFDTVEATLPAPMGRGCKNQSLVTPKDC
jgi:hypothetical protein